MDSPFTPPTAEAAIQQCLSQFSADLGSKYCDEQTVPTRDSGVHRFVGTRKGGGTSFICLRTYGEPLTAWDIDQQRVVLEGIRQTRHPYLSPLMDHRFETHGHYVVSGPVGTVALHEYLKLHRHVSFSSLCDFMGLLAEALEGAVEARWPRCTIDTHSLLLSECTEAALCAGVCLPVPPLPGPELRAPGSAPLPASSVTYVGDMALLACELLGAPARSQRFKPIAQVGAVTNQFLRGILEGHLTGQINGARMFAHLLRSTSASESNRGAQFSVQPAALFADATPPPVVAQRASIPQITATTMAATSSSLPPPVISPVHALRPLPRQPQISGTAPRVRLKPRTGPLQSTVTLCIANKVTVGRATSSDHVAQFFPRNPRNDERTRMVSREHLTLEWTDGAACLVEASDVNQSFVGGQPIGKKLRLGGFARISIAGEYDLEVRHLPSWWSVGQLWEGCEGLKHPAGAILLAPMQGTSTIEARTLWLFTDAAFGIEQNGALNLQPTSVRDVIGWFVRDEQNMHIVTAESDGVVRLNGEPLHSLQPCTLKSGDVLRVGGVDLDVITLPVTP